MTDGEPDEGAAGVEVDPVNRIVHAYHAEWRREENTPDLSAFWESMRAVGIDDEERCLAALIKADLRWRFARGERPSVVEYLDRFPTLRAARERMVSLVYEEYCLLEERGEGIDTEEFCGRYSSLKDSIASQLRYHRMFSQIVASPEAPKFPRAGEDFLRFHLVKEMGRGGSARVFQAEEIDVGRRLVVLKISPDKGQEPSIQGRLDHPHIARVLTVARPPEEGGLRGLSMPFRPGFTLDEVIRRVQPGKRPAGANVFRDVLAELGPPALPSLGWHGFPEGASYARGVAWLLSKIARALAHAHERGILHRDVKPANILLTTTDGPVLLDFNLAYAPNTTDGATAALRGGTLPYMAPEQLLAFLDDTQWDSVGFSADLYAVGLILTELLTGCRPQVPDPELPLPRAIGELLDSRDAPRRSVHAQNPAVPHALDAVIARCLQKQPGARYPSATALAEDLEAIAAGEPLRHTVNTSRVETSLSWMSRNRVRLAVGAAVLLVATSVAIFGPPIVASYYIREAETAIENTRFRDAGEKLRLAQWLSPNDPRVESALGHVAYCGKRYPESLARFNRALMLAATRPGSLTDWETACLRERRSQADLDWARMIQEGLLELPDTASGRPPSDFIQERVIEARDDLRRAGNLAGTEDESLLYRIGLGKVHAEIHLGELASARGDHVAAFSHYRLAFAYGEQRLKSTPRHPQAPIWRLDLDKCMDLINERLEYERSFLIDPA